jgi:protein-L-isoaspartate O-methyltransferase
LLGGEGGVQQLTLFTRRSDGGFDEKRILAVRFVPLVPGTQR